MISVKRLLLALALLLVPTAITQAQQQVNVAPDCNFSFNFSVVANAITAPARVPPSQGGGGIVGFDNRAVACTSWTVVYQADTAISALSLELDSAPNNSGVPGSWTAFTGFPVTTTVQGSGTVTAFFPWVSVTLGSATGTGTVSGRVFGYKPASGGLSGGGGGTGVATGLGNPQSPGLYVTQSDVMWFQNTGQNGATFFHTFRLQVATCATGAPTGAVYDAVAQGTAWTTTYTSGTNGGQGTGKFFPVCGWLVSASELITGSGTQNGQNYGQGFILSSMPSGGNTATSVGTFVPSTSGGTLLFGTNMSSFYIAGWNVGGGNLVTSSLAGPGFIINENPSNPAAGANFSAVLGSLAQKIQLVSVHFTLTTSAVQANRTPCVTIGTGGGTVVMKSCVSSPQPAGQTVDYDFMTGVGGSSAAGIEAIGALPNNLFIQNNPSSVSTLASLIIGLQTGDTITGIWVQELRWQEQD